MARLDSLRANYDFSGLWAPRRAKRYPAPELRDPKAPKAPKSSGAKTYQVRLESQGKATCGCMRTTECTSLCQAVSGKHVLGVYVLYTVGTLYAIAYYV